ncbi:hypothetical protein G6O67_006093 [Ophiocordyceps sinensis]|uniref:Uncharacterized protein n=1 Tax=Ophiocordyceps sinensis TaxID=72228 RepID=A0A8H4PMB4_9HYPO|nr:hypothetical protein G6O67_006093 [Ophiocordyceps sinensis]
MAPPGFDDVSPFEGSQIAASVTSDQAMEFFEILSPFRTSLSNDPRLSAILQPFIERDPVLAFTLGPDDGSFYSLSKDEAEVDQRHLIVVYMWRPKAKLEFSHGSHIGPTKGVTASNGLVHRPYKHLSETKGLRDVEIDLEHGGILVVHRRLAFQVRSSIAVGFVCEKSEQ